MPFIFVRASRVRHQRRGSLISVISVIIPLWTPVQRVLRPTVLSRSCPSAIATWSPGALSFRCHLAVRSRNASDLADFCDFNEWSYKLVNESRQATNLQSDLERVMRGGDLCCSSILQPQRVTRWNELWPRTTLRSWLVMLLLVCTEGNRRRRGANLELECKNQADVRFQ